MNSDRATSSPPTPFDNLFDRQSEVLQATSDGGFVLVCGRCTSCSNRTFPKASVCPECMSEDVVSEPLPGRGVLYSFTHVHVGPDQLKKPITLGYVDLADDIRIFSRLIDIEHRLSIDCDVVLDVAQIGADDGTPIMAFVFKPAESR